MPASVSLQQIAIEAGVTKGTVSLALRNHPRISAATRARVQAVADRLGYRPNPSVAAWMAHRRRVAPKTGGASIAFLNSWPVLAEWQRSPWFTRFVDGARRRATALGFGFEESWLAEPGMTPARMSEILGARGIRGVLIGSLPETGQPLELDWTRFAAVAQSHTLTSPELSRSLSDYASAMQLALCELRQLGYRRIGYASASLLEARTQKLNLGAYLGDQSFVPATDRVAVLDWSAQSSRCLERWIHEARPDALISHDVAIQEVVRSLGVRVPQDLGVAVLCRHPGATTPSLAGIDQQLERCGEVSIDLLVSQLHHNELGPPAQPIIALTRGVWVPGSTLRHAADKPEIAPLVGR